MTTSAYANDRRVERDRLGAWLRGASVAWVIGMTTVFPAGNEALERVSVLTFDRAAFLVVLALAALWIARTPQLLRCCGWPEAAMAIYATVVVASWMTSLAGKTAVDVKRDIDLLLTSIAMPLTAFVVARHGGWDRARAVPALWLVVIVSGTFLIVVGLIQGIVDWRFLVDEAHQAVHRSRSRGPFANALPYSAVLAVLIPLAVVIGARAPRPAQRRIVGVVCAGLVEALLLSQLRIAWVAAPLALLWLAAVCPSARRVALLVAAGIALLVALALMGLDLRLIGAPDSALAQKNGSVRERLEDAEPTYNRVAVYATALNMIGDRPLFGYGFGGRTFVRERDGYFTSCCGISPEWAVICQVPHNEVLNLLVLMGVVGLLAYLGVLVALWGLLTATRRSDSDGAVPLAAAAQAGIIGLAIIGQLHDVMYLYAAETLLFFVAGLSTATVART